MIRSIRARIVRAALIAGLSATAALGTAGFAFAGPPVGQVLQPGQTVCTPAAFAGHKVRLNENATPGSTRTVLYRDGINVGEIYGPGPHVLGGTSVPFGGFPGAGTYQGCATNISSGSTTALLQLFVDAEVK